MSKPGLSNCCQGPDEKRFPAHPRANLPITRCEGLNEHQIVKPRVLGFSRCMWVCVYFILSSFLIDIAHNLLCYETTTALKLAHDSSVGSLSGGVSGKDVLWEGFPLSPFYLLLSCFLRPCCPSWLSIRLLFLLYFGGKNRGPKFHWHQAEFLCLNYWTITY